MFFQVLASQKTLRTMLWKIFCKVERVIDTIYIASNTLANKIKQLIELLLLL